MRYDVISLHFTNDCNSNCDFCYRREYEQKSFDFWFECIPYFKKLTEQIALGGGEPYLYPEFIQRFSKQFPIVNVTTSGSIDPEIVNEHSKDVSMISVSYDDQKWNSLDEYIQYVDKIQGFKGANVLLTKAVVDDLVHTVETISDHVSTTFLLYPKYIDTHSYSTYRKKISYLSLFEHIYADECLYKLHNEGIAWEHPCGRGKKMVSINPDGTINACSFDDKIIHILEHPEQLMEIPQKIEPYYYCPYMEW